MENKINYLRLFCKSKLDLEKIKKNNIPLIKLLYVYPIYHNLNKYFTLDDYLNIFISNPYHFPEINLNVNVYFYDVGKFLNVDNYQKNSLFIPLVPPSFSKFSSRFSPRVSSIISSGVSSKINDYFLYIIENIDLVYDQFLFGTYNEKLKYLIPQYDESLYSDILKHKKFQLLNFNSLDEIYLEDIKDVFIFYSIVLKLIFVLKKTLPIIYDIRTNNTESKVISSINRFVMKRGSLEGTKS